MATALIAVGLSLAVMFFGIYAGFCLVGKDDYDLEQLENPEGADCHFSHWLGLQKMEPKVLVILSVVMAVLFYLVLKFV